MTADQFRRLALSFPGAAEGAHQGHADFRAGGKIFATLGYPSEKWGMLKLTPTQQAEYLRGANAVQSVEGGLGPPRLHACLSETGKQSERAPRHERRLAKHRAGLTSPRTAVAGLFTRQP